MTDPDLEDRAPPTPPKLWQWLVTVVVAAGSLVGAAFYSVLGDVLGTVVRQRLGALPIWLVVLIAAAVGSIGVAALVVQEVRSRLGRQRVTGQQPRRLVPGSAAGVVTGLPPGTRVVGREDELTWVEQALHKTNVAVLFGRYGVGTSACAMEAAARWAAMERTKPGYLDLRAGGRPLGPRRVEEVVFGLPNAPGLLVLDNVTTAAQVRPLLSRYQHRLLIAGGPGLDELDGVSKRHLAEPTMGQAVELFRAICESVPAGAAPDAVIGRLVEICGRQPALVAALAYRMETRAWTPDAVLSMLHTELAAGTWQRARPNATLTLLLISDRAYLRLRRGARRLYRLLAIAPQPLSRDEAAAVTGVSRRRADRLLTELAGGGFVDSAPDERYAVRPLLADNARLHLQFDEPVGRRVRAYRRLLEYLAGRAERYAGLLPAADPARPVLLGVNPHAWFERHERQLEKLVCLPWGEVGAPPRRPRRRIRRAWLRLAIALCGWYAAQRRLERWANACNAVLGTPVARRPAVASWAHNELGVVRRLQGDPRNAESELNRAVALRPRHGAAQARTNLGLALLDLRRYDEAIEELQRARRQRSRRDRGGQALTELGLGVAFLANRDPAQAQDHLVLAANAFGALGDTRGLAAALVNLVLADWSLGERLDAAHAWYDALEVCPHGMDPRLAAAAHLHAAATLLASPLVDHEEVRRHAARSLWLRTRHSYPRGRALLYLGDAAEKLRGAASARHRWQAAADACEQDGDTEGREAARARLDSPTR